MSPNNSNPLNHKTLLPQNFTLFELLGEDFPEEVTPDTPKLTEEQIDSISKKHKLTKEFLRNLNKKAWKPVLYDADKDFQAVYEIYDTSKVFTRGILTHRVTLFDGDSDMVQIWNGDKPHSLSTYLHGRDRNWHTNLESAKISAQYKIEKKIRALEKQIRKLKGMRHG